MHTRCWAVGRCFNFWIFFYIEIPSEYFVLPLSHAIQNKTICKKFHFPIFASYMQYCIFCATYTNFCLAVKRFPYVVIQRFIDSKTPYTELFRGHPTELLRGHPSVLPRGHPTILPRGSPILYYRVVPYCTAWGNTLGWSSGNTAASWTPYMPAVQAPAGWIVSTGSWRASRRWHARTPPSPHLRPLSGQLATGSETPLDQFHKTIENNRSETVS